MQLQPPIVAHMEKTARKTRSVRRFEHTVGFGRIFWEFAQRQSGLTVPASWIREFCNEAMMRYLQEHQETTMAPVEMPVEAPPEVDYEAQWREFGCQIDPFDDDFTDARKAWVAAAGGDEPALIWLRGKVDSGAIKYPRGFIISWFNKRKG
jgi:hypothetical protein